MSRDMKPRIKSPPQSARGGTLVGIFVGLIIGALVAAGLAWYFTRPTVFQAKQAPATPAPGQVTPAAPVPAAKPAEAPAEPVPLPGKPGDKPVDKMKFDFYKLLPEGQNAVPEPGKVVEPSRSEPREQRPAETRSEQPKDKADKAAPPAADATSKLAPGEKVWLQLGAFRNPVEADNLKARLALQGIEAQVQKLESPDKTLYRVRTGPYSRLEDAESARGQLALAGQSASVVRSKP